MKRFILIYSIFFGFLFFNVNAQTAEKKRSKIAIVSLFDSGYKHIGQYSDWNKKAYAQKHGYDIYLHHELLDPSRPAAWSKIPAIEMHLNDYDWIFWTDADSLIMNNEILLESIIDDSYDLIITRESTRKNLNTGSFLIKNSEWSRQLLKDIYKQEQFINAKGYWEQAALKQVLKNNNELYKNIKIIHQRIMNSHLNEAGGEFQPGDFIIHFYTPMNKAKFMANYYNLALNFELQNRVHLSESELSGILNDIDLFELSLAPSIKVIASHLNTLIGETQAKRCCLIGDVSGILAQEILHNTKIEKLFTVDNHTSNLQWSQQHFDALSYKVGQRLAIFENRCVLINNSSIEAAHLLREQNLDFIFLNNLNTSVELFDSLSVWFDTIRPGCIIAGLDLNENLNVISSFLEYKNSQISINSIENKMWWIVKP